MDRYEKGLCIMWGILGLGLATNFNNRFSNLLFWLVTDNLSYEEWEQIRTALMFGEIFVDLIVIVLFISFGICFELIRRLGLESEGKSV